jgi:hypothetical protein
VTGCAVTEGSSPLTALLTLEPRDAGAETVEPDVEFGDAGPAGDVAMCLISTVCGGDLSSDTCIATQ